MSGLHPPKGRDDGVGLVGDVDAVAPVLDHLLQAADLPLDAAQPGDLAGMVHGHAAVSVVRFAHLGPVLRLPR